MYQAVQQCTHCGANLSLDDMRRTDCPYCRTVYPHHSQAQQHAQVAGQMMGQLLGQQAAVQNQWRAAFGVGPLSPPGGQPGPGGAAQFAGGQAPGGQYPGAQQFGAQYPGGQHPGAQHPGAQYPGVQMPGMPPGGYYDPNQMINAHMAHAQQMSRRIGRQVIVSIALTFVLVFGILIAVFLLR